jgi:glycerophosphoryl diester phosphodiesterase
MKSISKSWSDGLKLLRQSWRQVFLLHLVFTALGFILFSPLIAGVGRLLIMFSGQPALDDQDIVYFFLSAPGVFSLLLMLALLVTVLAFEQVALMRIAVGLNHGQQIRVVDALTFTLAKAGRVFDFIFRLVTRSLLLILPFLAIAFGLATLLIGEYDINYYLAQKPSEFWWAVILVGTAIVAMLALLLRKLVDWSLALALVLFADVSPGQSFARSNELTRNQRSHIFTVLFIWSVMAILLGYLLIVIIQVIGASAVPMVRESISLLVVLLGGFSVLWMLGNFVITAFTSGSFACLLIGFYTSRGPAVPVMPSGQANLSFGKWQFSVKNMAVILLVSVAAAGLTGTWLIETIQLNDKVKIVAHRGASSKAPENTLAAFRQAIEDKTDWIELDVQETLDGEVVVFHDSDFMKLAGDRTRVWEATLEEIGDIDIGSWFAPEYSDQRAPTLTEVLEIAKGKANVVIELKYYAHDQRLEQRVVDIVEASGMVSQTAIMSLNYGGLQKVRTMRPDWQIGLLSAKAIGNLALLDSDFLAVEKGMARSGLIRRVHKAGKKVFVWTVNDPVTMSRMMSLGVDGIITDEPEMARQVLLQRRDMNIAERLLIHTALLFGQPYTPRLYRDNSP